MASLDKASVNTISNLVPSVTAWVLRMREFYLGFVNPRLSNISKSTAQYDSLNFESLFDPSLLSKLQEEIKVADNSFFDKLHCSSC